jgi:hypothetical protein
VFDSNFSYFQIKNGDSLKLDSLKLIFETGDLAGSSPSLVAKAGIIFYGDDLIGWRSLARSWLERRVKSELQVIIFNFLKYSLTFKL